MSPLLIALVGSLPGAIVSIIVQVITLRNTRSLENLKRDIQQDIIRFTKWHEKRISALEAFYAAFADYLDFLRRVLYTDHRDFDLTPMHEFRDTLERQFLYLDVVMANKVGRYQGELLKFWNESMISLSERGEDAREAIRQRLDFEIPAYLQKLREDINQFSDPHYRSGAVEQDR